MQGVKIIVITISVLGIVSQSVAKLFKPNHLENGIIGFPILAQTFMQVLYPDETAPCTGDVIDSKTYLEPLTYTHDCILKSLGKLSTANLTMCQKLKSEDLQKCRRSVHYFITECARAYSNLEDIFSYIHDLMENFSEQYCTYNEEEISSILGDKCITAAISKNCLEPLLGSKIKLAEKEMMSRKLICKVAAGIEKCAVEFIKENCKEKKDDIIKFFSNLHNSVCNVK